MCLFRSSLKWLSKNVSFYFRVACFVHSIAPPALKGLVFSSYYENLQDVIHNVFFSRGTSSANSGVYCQQIYSSFIEDCLNVQILILFKNSNCRRHCCHSFIHKNKPNLHKITVLLAAPCSVIKPWCSTWCFL